MKTVLIVDDHPVMRLLFKTQLAGVLDIGTIVEADNGQSAVKIARELRPDLVILDLDLPQMSGMDVIPRLKALDSAILILVVSALNVVIYGSRTLRLGADGFISKTEDVSGILRAVEMVMAGYSVFPSGNSAPPTMPLQGQELIRPGVEGVAQFSQLTNKEMLVLGLLVKGLANQAIADTLHISHKTVSSHKVNLMKKLGVSNVVELVDTAKRFHLTL
jgi:two-component system response regulator EvgA